MTDHHQIWYTVSPYHVDVPFGGLSFKTNYFVYFHAILNILFATIVELIGYLFKLNYTENINDAL